MRNVLVVVSMTAMACGGRTPLGDEPLIGDGTRIGDAGGSTGAGAPSNNRNDATPPGGNAGPVHGMVVDVEGRAYPGVELRLGSTTTTTDNTGRFAVANAPATYDVSIVLYDKAVYAYSGLSRRDPTLRIY